MNARDIDGYLDAFDEPRRGALEERRRSILALVRDAEQCLSYGMPEFNVHGTTVAGLAAFKNHLSNLPQRGSVLATPGDVVSRCESTKGSLQFPPGEPLPAGLGEKLVPARMREAGLD